MITDVCDQCGEEYDHYPSNRERFCSRECYMAWNRGRNHPQWQERIGYKLDGDGYPAWHDRREGEDLWLKVHRLAAVVEYGFDAVAEADVVHHLDEEPWNSAPENLTLMHRSEHVTLHRQQA